MNSSNKKLFRLSNFF